MPRILLLLLTLFLAGCALPKADPEREAEADHVYQLVRRGDVVGLSAMATPLLRQQDVNGAVAQMRPHVYASDPTGARTLSWTSNRVNADASYQVVRLYTHPEGEVQVQVLMTRSGDTPWQLNGVHVQRVTAQAREAYDASVEAAKFTLNGKSPVHYLVLLGMVLSATLCVVTAVAAGIRRRWAWMIGSLFGVCQLTLNWTTGAIFFSPIHISLLGAGFLKGLGAADPWFLSVAIPLPAILFWALGKWRPKPPKRKPDPNEADKGWSET